MPTSPGAENSVCSTLREGIVAGLIGAALTALWFLGVDAFDGRPLRTPALLGQALLGDLSPTVTILAYTAIHLAAFALFGVLTAVLVELAERQPVFVFALVALFASFEVFALGLIVVAAQSILDELAAWTVLVANLLASVGMLGYYFRCHLALVHRLTSVWQDDG
jgi:hypothetical protein